MSISLQTITRNLTAVQRRIADAAKRAGRMPEAITLVAVTKSMGPEEVSHLYHLGVRHFGENRVEAQDAKRVLDLPEAVWHMIGPVQRRKAKAIAACFDTIDSIDRVEAAEAISTAASALGKVIPILVEVNVSGEESKHGFEANQLEDVLVRIHPMGSIRVEGLMTMAPFECEPEETRPVFRRLRELAQIHSLPELSMGMTNDFEVAIEEGATQVRVGSALFK